MRWGAGVIAACTWACIAGNACAELLVNEVFYDPAGRDDGLEFVEILNTGLAPESVSGVVLDVWRGTRGWRRAWEGDGTLGPGEILLVHARTGELAEDFPNESGSVRLRRADVVLDVIGWGDVTAPEWARGRACADVSSGQSLARIPDGRDTGDNASDVLAADPSPGQRNGSPGALFALDALACDPAVPWPGRSAHVRCALTTLGRDSVSMAGTDLRVVVRDALGESDGVLREMPSFVRPDSARIADAEWMPRVGGRAEVTARLATATDTTTARDTIWVGPGALAVSEVMYAPPRGDPEWIELVARDDTDLAAYALIGPHAERVALPAVPLRAGEHVVLCADADTLARAFPPVDRSRCIALGRAFPALPARSGGSSPAHAVSLLDASGVRIESVPYDALGGRTGRSLERLTLDGASFDAATWQACVAEIGATPAATNSAAASDGRSLHVDVLDARATIDLGDAARDVRVTLFTVGGARVREVARWTSVRGRLTVPVATTGMRSGLYALVVDATSPAGVERRAVTLAVP